jgi:hypothetical protein
MILSLPEPFLPPSLVDPQRQGPALSQVFPPVPKTNAPESVDPVVSLFNYRVGYAMDVVAVHNLGCSDTRQLRAQG